MASGVSPTRRSMNRQIAVGQQLNSSVQGGPGMSLPGVDPEELKGRLYSYAPQQAIPNRRALHFTQKTKAQLKRASIPSAPKLEPLVCEIIQNICIHIVLLKHL